MLIRIALLFALFAGGLYVFLSCFGKIDRKTWGTFFRALMKVLVCLMFGAAAVASLGIVSQLTN
jgi:hypothetical protein